MKKKIIIGLLCMILIAIIPIKGFDLITGSAVETHAGTFEINNFPPVVEAADFIGDAGDLVTISYNVSDPNGDSVTVSFGSPLNSSGQWQSNSSSYGITNATITASDGNSETNYIVSIKLRPYCGDGICDFSAIGEYCGNCEEDCGECPVPITVPVSTGGGGGGGGVSEAYAKALEEEIAKLMGLNLYYNVTNQFTVNIDELFVELQEYEFVGKRISIDNYHINRSLIIGTEIIGEIKDSVILDTKYLTVPPGGNSSLDLLIIANKPPGKYYGDLILASSNYHDIIPITLKIIRNIVNPEQETLDIDVDVITQQVAPGEYLKFKINMRKAPLIIEEPEDVFLRYLVMQLNTKSLNLITGATVQDLKNLTNQTENVFYEEEEFELVNAVSFPKEIKIPKDFATGNYVLNINAKFKGKQIPVFVKFTVKVPWYNEEIFGIKKGLLLIFIILLALVWVAFVTYKAHYASLKKKQTIKIDRTTLPKKGPRSAYVGIVPEANRKAYIQLEDLKTHTLVAGTTGSGKTIAAQVIVEEALKKEVSIIVFDPTAQWSGFLRKCNDRHMIRRYKAFGMQEKDAKSFPAKVHQVEKPKEIYDVNKLMKDRMTIILLDKLNSKELNVFIANTIGDIFKNHPTESKKLRLLIVFDEVHRLLPKFGGSKQGYNALEKSVREFRKWGIGILLVSQVTQDLIGAIEANIATQIQMKTNDKEDLARVDQKYGQQIFRAVFRAPMGTGLLGNSAYNSGKPYFVAFRPLLHNTPSLKKKELAKHIHYSDLVEELKDKIAQIEAKKINVLDLSIQLELAEKQINIGKFDMAQVYLDDLIPKIDKKLGKKMSKKKKR
ncbi:DUF853 family protein [Candidatus Woesearchaeota archaeon]|nr:DUF853 family protein [Candidatus Woesearchaeota archaeon]